MTEELFREDATLTECEALAAGIPSKGRDRPFARTAQQCFLRVGDADRKDHPVGIADRHHLLARMAGNARDQVLARAAGQDVHLHALVAEPAAAACREHRRLGDLRQPEQLPVETPGGVLAAGRAGHLHVVDLHPSPPR